MPLTFLIERDPFPYVPLPVFLVLRAFCVAFLLLIILAFLIVQVLSSLIQLFAAAPFPFPLILKVIFIIPIASVAVLIKVVTLSIVHALLFIYVPTLLSSDDVFHLTLITSFVAFPAVAV